MNAFEQAWKMSTEHHFVSPTVRVTIQTRAVNTYTYVEDFVVGDGFFGTTRYWKIRRGTVQAHGSLSERHTDASPHPRLKAKARAEKLWHELKDDELAEKGVAALFAEAERRPGGFAVGNLDSPAHLEGES